MSRPTIFGSWVLFVLLPIILCGWCIVRGAEFLQASEEKSSSFLLAQETREMISESSPSRYVMRVFRGKMRPGDPPPKMLLRVFPESGSGKDSSSGGKRGSSAPDREPGGGDKAAFVPPELLALRKYLTDGRQLAEGELKKIQNLLGWGFQPHVARGKPLVPHSVRWGKGSAWLVWKKAPQGAELAIIHSPQPFSLMASELAVHIFPRTGGGAVLDLTARRWAKTPGIRVRDILSGGKVGVRQGIVNSRLFSKATRFEILQGGLGIYLELRLSGTPIEEIRKRVFFFSLLMLVFSTFAFSRLIRIASDWSLSGKVLGIFSYVVVLPLFSVGILSIGILEDRKQIREQELLQGAREELLELDAGFLLEERASQSFFKEARTDPDLNSGRFTDFSRKARAWAGADRLDFLTVFDWTGKRRVYESKNFDDPGFNKIAEMVARHAILEAEERPLSEGFSRSEQVLWGLLSSAELGYLDFIRQPNILHRFQMGSNIFYASWQLCPRSSSSGPTVMVFSRSQRQAVFSFLRKNLIRNRQYKVFAKDNLTGIWYPPGPERVPAFEALSMGISQSGKDQIGRFVFDGHPYLAIGIRGLKMDRFDLVALVPEERLAWDTHEMRRFISIGVGLALIISLACALFLTNGLLLPISDISTGLSHLKRGDTGHRIPVRNPDEMGKMANAFNHLLQTAGELDMAKTVQESLIPSIPTRLGVFRIEARCRMSTSVGGDYLDHYRLPGNRSAILVGDVTGHGISSALVMSMAKTAAFLHFREGGGEKGLLEAINQTLFELTTHEQVMTFCAAILDETTGMVEILFAGCPFPFLFKAGKRSSAQFGKPSCPIGGRASRTFPSLSIEMSEGDLLFLFTDGVYEAPDRDGIPLGFVRLQELVDIHGHKDPERFLAHVEEALMQGIPSRNLPDDVTLIAIKREVST